MTKAPSVIGLPIRLRLDYGQPALFRETDIAILTHFIIYYALVLFCVVFRTYIQCVADQEAATNHPWIKLIKQRLGRGVSINKVEQHYSSLLELKPFSIDFFDALNGSANNVLGVVTGGG